MKKLLGILCISCVCLFTACNSTSSSEDSVDSAEDINDSLLSDDNSAAMSTAPVSEEDAEWAVEIANGGMTEIELSKVAQTKATSERVKNFANMMVNDHTGASEKLKQLAAAKNITLPASLSDKSQKDLEDLNKKSGKDFDEAYVDFMVDDHQKDVDKFKKGSTDLKDADLKNFAAETLPKIQMHLDSIKAIDDKK